MGAKEKKAESEHQPLTIADFKAQFTTCCAFLQGYGYCISRGLVRLPGAVCGVLVTVGSTHGYEQERLPGAWCRDSRISGRNHEMIARGERSEPKSLPNGEGAA